MHLHKSLKLFILSILVLLIAGAAFFCVTTAMSTPETLSLNSQSAEAAKLADYDNYILLAKDHATVVSAGKKQVLSYDALAAEPRAYMNELKKQEIKIIVTKEADYKRVVDVLDIMTMEKVSRYKLLQV